MDKDTTENPEKKTQRASLGQKQQILIIFGLVIVAFNSLTIYGFISLNNRLKLLEKTKSKERCTTIEEQVVERDRRSTKTTSKIDILQRRIFKLEERLNQSSHSVACRPAFVLRGPQGKPGRDGIPGRDGMPGRDGTSGRDGISGTNGRDGRDGAQGPKGIDCKRGALGDQGLRGQQGPRGISGQKGDQGSPGVAGVSYVQWGKRSCSNNGTKLVYEGYVGGSHYNSKGGGANYVCLTRNPVYEKFQDGFQYIARIYGTEYESKSHGIFPSSRQNHEVPCVLCHVDTRATQMMIPGTNVCPAGWTREYKGYLMAPSYTHHRAMYTCVDENPDYIRGTHADIDGALFYFVEGQCGALPCKPYVNGRELTCAVCTR